jgi:mannose-1-phosphate guanylyltransferase
LLWSGAEIAPAISKTPKKDSRKHMDYSNAWAVVLAGGEGTRVRSFLQKLCGGSGLKQFSTIIGERSMLLCTLDRIERLIPRERILIVVSAQHRAEVDRQLPHWARNNIIFQPANRHTAPGILLPLAHITHRDPGASVVVFPSDHFILDEEKFMDAVASALAALAKNPDKMILLGMTPQSGEESEYGYIVSTAPYGNDAPSRVIGFVEKPPLAQAKQLIQRGALWNTMVFAVHNQTLWDMVQRTSPVLYHAFRLVQLSLHTGCPDRFLNQLYETIPSVNFSSAICEPLSSRLCVLPVADVGWSDWGTVGSIVRTLQKLGRFDALAARMDTSMEPQWYTPQASPARGEMPRPLLNTSSG